MKQIGITICAMISCLIVQAQSFNVEFYPGLKSLEPKLVKHKDAFYSFETDKQGMSGFSANLKRFMQNITLKKYDATLAETNKLRVAGQEKEFGPLPPSLKVVNDKLCLIYFKMNEKKNMTLYAAVADPSTLELAPASELLSIDEDDKYLEFYLRSVSTDHPNFYIYKSNFASSPSVLFKTFFFEASPAGTHFLVAWTSGWNNKMFYSVLDKDMKKLRTGIEKMPDEGSMAFSNACVDNSGNAYFSYSYSKKGKPISDILINKNEGRSEVKTITVPDADPFGAYMALTKESNKLLICGAYKDDNDYLGGVYIQSLTISNMSMSAVSKTAFPKDLVEILDEEGWASKKEKKFGLADGLVLEANMLDNGTMNLTGEFRRVTSGVRASFITAGSILNVRFNGTVAVFSRIPKVRVSAGSTFGDSYRLFGYKNSLIVFYNDHLANLQLDISKTPVRSDVYKNSVLAAAILDSNGVVKRQVVVDKSAEDYLASVESMQEMVAGNFFMTMRRIKGMGGVTSDMKWASLLIK